jgi:dTDP-4-dehydrorhamnose reductase
VKILLTGRNGQVGWELQRTLALLGEVIAVDYPEIDFASPRKLGELVERTAPTVIVNAAAYTAVDRAEVEPDVAMKINAEAPRALARAAGRAGALMIHYSTDYVFDGTKHGSYTEDDSPVPLNVYGRSKLAGDLAVQEECPLHLIFRTSWVYGSRGTNFLLTMLRKAAEQTELRVVKDQIGAPTWSRMLAEATAQILAKGAVEGGLATSWGRSVRGLYNLVSAGTASWYEFAQAIVAQAELPAQVVPILSSEYPTAAKRPSNSLLSCEKAERTFHLHLPSWKHCLSLCMGELAKATDAG